MKLTVYAVDRSLGFYRVKLNRRTIAAFVLPSYKVSLGMDPNRDDVLDSVRQIHPTLEIPSDVSIHFA